MGRVAVRCVCWRVAFVRLSSGCDRVCVRTVGFALPAEQDYWEPHVDQLNVAAYDVSAVLYLATQGSHFEGGS